MINFKSIFTSIIVSGLIFCLQSIDLYAQNPIIRNQFTADPSARVFNGRVYVFPSHDIPAPEGKNLRKDWFCMEDYHVFSSKNLIDWTDHGMIVSQYSAPWIDSTTYSMWAPDCIERNGKYYFYYPALKKIKDTTARKGFGIGVAISDKPEGPYRVKSEAIKGVNGIDPNVFIDKDGQAYLYWSQRHIFVAKLKENMVELDSEPMIIPNLPEKGLKEGPWVFERDGLYYLTFPHVENKIERLEYAVGSNPMGPFKMTGVIMDESPTGCWTNHHSVINYNNQWFLFYHHNDLSPGFDKNRSIRVDSLFFNTDGTIQKVIPTLRGVGNTTAKSNIEIDRYTAKSDSGVKISFFDEANLFKGWKTTFNGKNAWLQYNAVDFGSPKLRKMRVKARSVSGASLQIRLNSIGGILLDEVKVPKSLEWSTIETKLTDFKKGVHNLFVVSSDASMVELDWIQFE
jgi:hypothetical protein